MMTKVEGSRNAALMNPLAWLAAAFALGIVTESLADVGLVVWLSTGVVCLGLVPILSGRYRNALPLLIVFIAAGGVAMRLEKDSIGPDRLRRIYDEQWIPSGEPVELAGNISGWPEPAIGGQFVTVRANEIKHRGAHISASGAARVFVSTPSREAEDDLEALELRSGTRVSIKCRLEREDRSQNPGVRPRRQILDQQGIDATCSAKSPLLIRRLEAGGTFDPTGFARGIRAWAIGEMHSRFSPETAGVLTAATLGDKNFLDRRTATLFREGGTFHILVISGLHITFIGGIVLLILRFFTSDRRWHVWITLPVLWSFAVAVGAEAPVVRACLMFSAVLIGYALFRNSSPLNSLSLCVLFLLAWRPSDIFNPSFQLTFASVVGIIAFGLPVISGLKAIGSWMPTAKQPFPPNAAPWVRRLCETIYWNKTEWDITSKQQTWSAGLFKSPFYGDRIPDTLRRWAAIAADGIIISLAVQIWLLPLMVFYFHRVSFAGVVLNLWVGTMMAVQSFFAFAAIVLGNISGSLAAPFTEITELLNRIMVAVPGVAVDLGWASIRVPVYSGGAKAVYLLYFVPLIFAAAAIAKWKKGLFAKPGAETGNVGRKIGPAMAAAAVLGAVILFHPFSSPNADGNLTVEFLDVGQGDAAFITFPDGRTMLVDGGGRPVFRRPSADDEDEPFEPDIPRIGEAVVSEFLWERGYDRVDLLAATHADADHEQGLVDVAGNFKISGVFLAAQHGESEDTRELFEIMERRRLPLVELEAGSEFEIAGVRVEVLYPPSGPENDLLSKNDRSLVLRLTFGDRIFLLTGDIEEAGERWLLEQKMLRTVDVVKVPHHGSRTSSSSEFVAAVAAEYAVIPVGKRSRYGHPHQEVVERWKNAGAFVLTTGEKGTIRFTTDGYGLNVSYFRP